MALMHNAFLLDYVGFKEKAISVVAALDVGDARPLYEQALAIVLHTDAERWILNVAGSSLLDIRKVNSIGIPITRSGLGNPQNAGAIPPSEIGYWLLLVYSAFLGKCPGIGYNYSILEAVLSMLGWNQDDTRLLCEGSPTSLLLKPDVDPVLVPSAEDPYWHWMSPRAHASGWLSQEQVYDLYRRLLLEEQPIRTFNYKRFGDHLGLMPTSVPDGQVEYLGRLHEAYGRAITMLERA